MCAGVLGMSRKCLRCYRPWGNRNGCVLYNYIIYTTIAALLIARWRHGRCRASEIFNVGTTEGGERTSWGSEGRRRKRPIGVRGGAPEQKNM